ncbi:MAG: hydrolase [Bacteroidales bacterium]
MKIFTENSTGLIVDYQEKLVKHMFESDVTVRNTGLLIQGLIVMEIPLIVTQQYTKGLGETVSELAQYLGGIQKTEKLSFSCYGEPAFVQQLVSTGRKTVIIAGIEAHVCVLQTVLDLLESGFQPVVVEDCITSRKLNDKEVAMKRMRDEGAIITTFESLLFELCKVAGNEKFKAISKLVK